MITTIAFQDFVKNGLGLLAQELHELRGSQQDHPASEVTDYFVNHQLSVSEDNRLLLVPGLMPAGQQRPESVRTLVEAMLNSTLLTKTQHPKAQDRILAVLQVADTIFANISDKDEFQKRPFARKEIEESFLDKGAPSSLVTNIDSVRLQLNGQEIAHELSPKEIYAMIFEWAANNHFDNNAIKALDHLKFQLSGEMSG